MTEKRLPSPIGGDLPSSIPSLTLAPNARPAGPPDEIGAPLGERWIAASAVRQLCAGISDMTLWRWLNNDELGFPKPSLIARRRYWRYGDVIAWLEARAPKVTDRVGSVR